MSGPLKVDALGKPSPKAHDWKGDGYCCEVCWSSLHCTQCADGCGGQGHLVRDADGFYFWCQEPQRWQRQTDALRVMSAGSTMLSDGSPSARSDVTVQGGGA